MSPDYTAPKRRAALLAAGAIAGIAAITGIVLTLLLSHKPRGEDLKADHWQSLFDGKTLKGWRVVEGGKFNPIHAADVEEGRIILPGYEGWTGLRWTGSFPASDYELQAEVCRVAGDGDLFNIVFPAGDERCTLYVGGWDGVLVGLDMVDGVRLDRNETRTRARFAFGHWYAVRLRVTKARVQAWIDNEKVVDLERAGRQLALSREFALVEPLAICATAVKTAVRSIRFQPVEAEPEKAPAPVRAGEWQRLLDGTTLRGWETLRGSERRVEVEGGRLVLRKARGKTTAAAWTGGFPKMDYELRLDVMWVDGANDFLKLTFPLGDCYGVLGLHAGSVALLNTDGRFPYNNDTRREVAFERNRWYAVRLRVTTGAVEAWIDGEQVAREATNGYRFAGKGTRRLQIETWDTTGAYRNIEVRQAAGE